jgi:hypothetical protein
MSIREPILHPVRIADLRPTQITVGMREVEAKRQAWRGKLGKAAEKAGEFLGSHMVPVIHGPKDRQYVIDHHHLCRALHEEGQETVLVNVVGDLSALETEAFWFNMDCRGWTHPFDAAGRRRGYEDVPKSMADLVDDPYRSLAGELRFAGGYAKDTTPFSEFLWADFLRQRIKPKVLSADFDAAVAQALGLAKGAEAGYLPGWCGPNVR